MSQEPKHKPVDPNQASDAKQESTPSEKEKHGDKRNTLLNRPVDANQTGVDIQIPPGVEPNDMHDPGSQTPGAPPVDNRS